MVKNIIQSNFTIPPLENGDRLTRTEFEQRYERMPNLKKAELIEGIVYMGSPLRIDQHGTPHAYIIGWLVQLDVNALLGRNLAKVLTVLQQGIASQEHQDFINQLSE
jgi:hypothetical protein